MILAVLKKDCPRCGGDIFVIDDDTSRNVLALCPKCGLGTLPCHSHEEALMQWFSRRQKEEDKLKSLSS